MSVTFTNEPDLQPPATSPRLYPGELRVSPQDRAEIREALAGAQELLKQHGWIQNALALDAAGAPVCPTDSRAQCFCIQGAILRATPHISISCMRGAMQLLHVVAKERTAQRCKSVFEFNDHPSTTLDAILELLRQAEAAFADDGRHQPI